MLVGPDCQTRCCISLHSEIWSWNKRFQTFFLLSTVHANQQDDNNMSTEGKYTASYVGKEMTVALLWSLTWLMGITVPFQKKWDMSHWGRERKGVRQGGGEERCPDWISQDINHHLRTAALAWRQWENEEEGKERSWKRDIGMGLRRTEKTSRAGMK